MYAVVEFLPKAECGVVPLTWINHSQTKCYWPRSVSKKQPIDIIVKNQTPYNKSWPKYRIKRIYMKTAEYSEACIKLEEILKNAESEDSSTSFVSKKSVSYVDGSDTGDSSSSSDDDADFNKMTNSRKINNDKNQYEISNTANSPSISSTPTTTLSVTSQTEFELTCISQLAKISETMDQHGIILNELLRSHRECNINNIKKPKEIPELPIKSLGELEILDDKLKCEEINSYMIHRLAAVGGSGVESHVRRILKFLLTDEVAISYNWKGRDKLSFEKTSIMKVIYCAVKRSFPVNEGTDLLIENAVKDWLKYAKARSQKKK